MRNYATNHKLDEDKVKKIHKAYKNRTHNEFDLARIYGVSLSTIYNIVLGRSWKWLKLEPLYKKERRWNGTLNVG